MMIYVLAVGEYSSYEIVGVYNGPPGADIAAMRKEWNRLHDEQRKLLWSERSDWEDIARQWLKEHRPDFEELDWQEMWTGRDWD